MNAIEWIKARLEDGRLTVDDLARLVPFAQRELGVSDDGKPGKGTLGALEAATAAPALKIPRNRKAALKYYGNPSWTKTGKGRRVDIDDAWEHANIRSFRLHTGKRVRMHRLVGDHMVELFGAACTESGYTPKSVQTYVPRVIGGTDRLSMHALGCAFDVDPRRNPWGGRVGTELSDLRKNMAECESDGRRSFVQVFEDAGVIWGGRWRHPTNRRPGWGDDMHIQFAGV